MLLCQVRGILQDLWYRIDSTLDKPGWSGWTYRIPGQGELHSRCLNLSSCWSTDDHHQQEGDAPWPGTLEAEEVGKPRVDSTLIQRWFDVRWNEKNPPESDWILQQSVPIMRLDVQNTSKHETDHPTTHPADAAKANMNQMHSNAVWNTLWCCPGNAHNNCKQLFNLTHKSGSTAYCMVTLC